MDCVKLYSRQLNSLLRNDKFLLKTIFAKRKSENTVRTHIHFKKTHLNR